MEDIMFNWFSNKLEKEVSDTKEILKPNLINTNKLKLELVEIISKHKKHTIILTDDQKKLIINQICGLLPQSLDFSIRNNFNNIIIDWQKIKIIFENTLHNNLDFYKIFQEQVQDDLLSSLLEINLNARMSNDSLFITVESAIKFSDFDKLIALK